MRPGGMDTGSALFRRLLVRCTRAAGVGLAALVGGIALASFALTMPRDETQTAALAAPHFVDETDGSGIDHVYDGDAAFAEGGGVAALDCNGDGKPDLYLAGGHNPSALYRNDSPVGGAPRFTSLPDPVTDLGDVTGAYPIDIDGDGLTDLVVLRKGESVILQNLGDCHFERANKALGLNVGSALTTAFSAKWEG